MSNIRVKKRNGRLESFEVNKINKFVERTCENLSGVSASEVVLDMETTFYDKIPTSEIDKSIELTARQKIYKEPNYSYVAARVVLSSLYKEVLKESVDADTFETDYKNAFVKNIKRSVKEGVLDSRLLDYDLKELSEYLNPDRDLIFKYVGIKNVYDRYLFRDKDKVVETPQAFYMRVAMGLCFNEDDPQRRVKELYDVYSQHLASPSTPTLFNSGTTHNQLSSCYLSEIHDSVDGIFDGLWQEARKSKYAGGLGFHVSKIRATGSHIKGTNGTSSGLIPWLKIYNDMLVACDQAGKRRGSGCAYLEPWHLDVVDFVDLRKVGGEERRRCHDLNTALWCCDLFFKRIKNDEKCYALKNISDAIDASGADDDDIIILLDGDDWLASGLTLGHLNTHYRDSECWMTYGSYVMHPYGVKGPEPSAYPQDIIDNNTYRKDTWRASHLRTFRKKVWDKIDKKDLQDTNGDFYKMAYDQAIMLPLIEMSGDRCKYLEDILHVYNKENPLNVDKIKAQEQVKTAKEIRAKKPYERL